MNENDILYSVIYLRERIDDLKMNTSGFIGTLVSLNDKDIVHLTNINEITTELYITDSGNTTELNSLQNHIDSSITFNVSTGSISYYETFDSFISGNTYKVNTSSYYIHDIQFLESEASKTNIHHEKYRKNLEVIDILRLVSDYEKFDSGQLELFYYNANNGGQLNLDYNKSHLKDISTDNLEELREAFINKIDSQERMQIFKYELISLLGQNNSYPYILKNWDRLINNYSKSFEIYLTGFSFEKLKTSSNDYFLKLSDRIQQTIGKVSNYIFAIPIAFIFLLKYFDFKGNNYTADFLLLLVGFLFLILIWMVPFKNISESIENIKDDIEDYRQKINKNKSLTKILEKLNHIEKVRLRSQETKLVFTKVISILIFLIVLGAFLYIHHCDDIVSFLKKLTFV